MPLVVTLAVRYLLARMRQSLLTIGGVALGIIALSVIQAMMGGFSENFVVKTLANAPHITVRQKDLTPFDPAGPTRRWLQALSDPTLVFVGRPPLPDEAREIRNPAQVRERIEQVQGVTATAAAAGGEVQFGFHGRWEPVSLNGIVPEEQDRVLGFSTHLKEGSARALSTNLDNAIIGYYLAQRMQVRVGERVTARVADGRSISLRIVGIYQGGIFDTDDRGVWVNLRRAQSILGLGSAVNLIQVRVADYNEARAVGNRIEAAAGLDAESWMEASSNTLGLLDMFTAIMTLVTLFTMTVAGFGIAGNLITTVAEKTFDIGVLMAMGLTSGRISMVFLLLATMMTAVGLVLGLGLSWWIIEALSNTRTTIKPQPGVLAYSDTMPMLKSWTLYAASAGFAWIISTAAALSPAIRAARLEPLNIIRNAG